METISPALPPSSTSSMRRSIVLGGSMCGVAAAGYALRPRESARTVVSDVNLERLVPQRFGAWEVDNSVAVGVVNPQTKELLDKLYNQILTRTYINPQGQRVMLSLAYGGDQRGSLAAHKPEVCYPAQGFKLRSMADGSLNTPFGAITVRRLDTSLGPRDEPVTYWFTLGDTTVQNRWERRLVEIRLALTGQIPDGLLFRVSSIDADAPRAWNLQAAFVSDLMTAVDSEGRRRLAGLKPA